LLKIKRNVKSKMYVVFDAPDSGKGLWRIKKSFKSRSLAEDYIKECEKRQKI